MCFKRDCHEVKKGGKVETGLPRRREAEETENSNLQVKF